MKDGKFITVEGIDGSGKTSLIEELAAEFRQAGRAVTTTREPGGTDLALRIRQLVLCPGEEKINSLTELFLFSAARSQHVQNLIIPKLKSGEVVICDRFTDSTLAYQGYGRELPMEALKYANQLCCTGLKIWKTFLLDLDPRIALQRTEERFAAEKNLVQESRFEEEKLNFHIRVRNGFLALAALDPERFQILDASKSQLQVATESKKVLRKALEVSHLDKLSRN